MLIDLNVVEFTEKTASKDAVPGGGSVAALSGAIASSLGAMVANLTIGKKKYLEVESEMENLAEYFEIRRKLLIDLIDEDASSFDGVIKGFKMPKDTEEDKKVRKEYLQKSFKVASEVPLKVAEVTSELFESLEVIVQKGNQNAVTDGMVAAMLARTAILSALLNVKINLGSIKDEEYVSCMNIKVNKLEKMAIEKEKYILGLCQL